MGTTMVRPVLRLKIRSRRTALPKCMFCMIVPSPGIVSPGGRLPAGSATKKGPPAVCLRPFESGFLGFLLWIHRFPLTTGQTTPKIKKTKIKIGGEEMVEECMEKVINRYCPNVSSIFFSLVQEKQPGLLHRINRDRLNRSDRTPDREKIGSRTFWRIFCKRRKRAIIESGGEGWRGKSSGVRSQKTGERR
jgi:hypothetical protein